MEHYPYMTLEDETEITMHSMLLINRAGVRRKLNSIGFMRF